jgi:hypothetical protein
MADRVDVWRGANNPPDDLFGPLPGLRLDDVIAYEFELPARFEPWPGRSRLERTFVLLDVGVSFANPCWRQATNADGSIVSNDPSGEQSWYVDLISVDVTDGDRYTFRDLYLDIILPADGRHHRMLDFDDYADAMLAGKLSLGQAADGLRRWQTFLDRYVYGSRWPTSEWSDFPPASIRGLMHAASPIGDIVRWNG